MLRRTANTCLTGMSCSLFFSFLIISAVFLGASASYLQNAVVALSASFGPVYLNQILSGQGAIGFVVAMIQFVAAYGAVKAAHPKQDPSGATDFRLQLRGTEAVYAPLTAVADSAKEVRQTAFAFFLTVLGVAVASLLAYMVLIHLPLYRLVFRSEFDSSAEHTRNESAKQRKGDKGGESLLRRTERKVRHLGVAIFLVFGVTLAVYPSITGTIVSVQTGEPDARLLQQPALFIPLGFAVFAGGDWLGRVLPQWQVFRWTDWKLLMACSVGRLIFIVRTVSAAGRRSGTVLTPLRITQPLFLLCNQSAGGSGRSVIHSDLGELTAGVASSPESSQC